MTYPMHTIAAAIGILADREIELAGVPNTDSDAMGRIMTDAERAMANVLARDGMDLTEAREMASKAAVQPGRQSPEATALADEAFRTRHDEIADEPAPAAATKADGTDMTESLIETAGDGKKESETAVQVSTAAARISAPTAPIPQIPYKVVWKKVSEVFRGVPASEPGFNFDLPIINWQQRHPKVPDIDVHYSFDLMHLHTVLYAVAEGVSLNIVGPHGAGKTQLIKQIAARLNFPVTTLPMDGQLSRRELIGQEKLRSTPTGNESYFAPGLLPKALAEPGFILFDELDRGVSDLQYACHSVYLQEGLAILEDGGRHVPFHELNRVFATANTKGRGSMDGMYQPPEEMSEATRDRWSLWLEIGYQEVDEDAEVLIAKTPGLNADHAQTIAKIAHDIRSAYLQGQGAQTCSMRQQLETARLAVFLCRGETEAERVEKCLRLAFERVILGRASESDRAPIETLIQARIPNAFVGDPLF